MSEQQNQLKATYYPESSGLPWLPGDLKGSVAVCFSGGGSRACTATMGQLRGLHALHLLEDIKCISSVSGGTWASILYTFRPANIDIETFLGGVVENPSQLTWDAKNGKNKAEILNYLDFNNLGMVPTRLGIIELLKTMIQLHHQYKYPACDLWLRTIGKLILEPFGLSTVDKLGKPTKYMGYTQAWIEENPIKLNPDQLSLEDFEVMPDDPLRPYLITNTSMFANPTTLIPFAISPAYEGIFNTLNIGENTFGGGYLDTYSFGSSNPKALKNAQVSVQQMAARACLADAAGLSSAFFALILEDLVLKAGGDVNKLDETQLLGFLDKEFKELSETVTDIGDLIPEFPYWPVGELATGGPQVRTVQFADGGNLENSGIMPLLQRSCTSIISFINSMTELEENDGQLVVDSTLPPLFGYCPKKKGETYKKYSDMAAKDLAGEDHIFSENQVFPSADFFPFLDKLATASCGSGSLGTDSALCVQNLTTVKNSKFGIEAGLSTKVLWVYNNPVASWKDQLSHEVRWMMDLNIMDYGDFPNYNTETKIHLDARQVNLLAHLSCWNILHNKKLFLSMWD